MDEKDNYDQERLDQEREQDFELIERAKQEKRERYLAQQQQRRKKRGIFDLKPKQVFQIVRFIGTNPSTIGWIIGAIIVFLVIYQIFFSPGRFFDYTPSQFTPEEPPVVIVPGITITAISYGEESGKTNINQVTNDENIVFEITVVYDSSADPAPPPKDLIVLWVPIPTGTNFASAGPPCPNSTVRINDIFSDREVWECPIGLIDSDTAVFYLTLRPTQDDFLLITSIRAGLLDPSGNRDLLGAQTQAVEQSTIGRPTSTTSLIFSKDELYSYLLQKDPKNANYWFYKIIPCESGFDPTLSTPLSGDQNLYGLFQLIANNNQPNEIGWQEQVDAAIKYNNETLNKNFSYWKCAE